MTVHVRYFAILREQRGLDHESLSTDAVTARDLVQHLIDEHGFTLPSSLIRVAANGVFVEEDYRISEGEEIVLIPPVAGG